MRQRQRTSLKMPAIVELSVPPLRNAPARPPHRASAYALPQQGTQCLLAVSESFVCDIDVMGVPVFSGAGGAVLDLQIMSGEQSLYVFEHTVWARHHMKIHVIE